MAKRDDKAQYIKISELKPYENNARTHSIEQIEAICNSIKEFGFINPVIIDENDMILVGHGRIEAAKVLGIDEAPYRRVTNLTEDQKRAYILADNKLSDLGGWDEELLAQELEEIELDMSLFGFEDINIGDFEINENTEEDEIPDIDDKIEPKAKRGEIYKLGNHFLMCGDSTSEADVKNLLSFNQGGAPVDMVFTDPPYSYNYQSNFRKDKFNVIENDDKILNFFPLLKNNVKGFVMVCTTWKVLDKWIPIFKQYFDLSNMIIWDKGGGGIGDLSHTFLTDYEIILCSNNGETIKNKRLGSVWDIGKDNVNNYLHPTQKPVALAAQAIKHTTDKNNTVLDLFGGSGSTLIACEQLGRSCYCMELDPQYMDVIIQRWENFTGKKAELVKEA